MTCATLTRECARTRAAGWPRPAPVRYSLAMRLLYHLPLSPFSRKIRLVLAEKRLPFELRIEKVWEKRPEYLQLNPAGTVPTLIEENDLVDRQFRGDRRIPRRGLSRHAAAGPHAGGAGGGAPPGRLVRRQVQLRGDAQPAGREIHEAPLRPAATRTRRRCAPATRRCASTCNMWAFWPRRGNGSAARRCRWPISPPPGISRRWISPPTWTGASRPRPRTGMRGSSPARVFAPLLADRVPGVTPPAHYADLDF